MVTVIKIKKKLKDNLEIAVKYYGLISILNNFGWTDFQIHILAYMAVKGNINAGGAKKEFLDWYGEHSERYLYLVLFKLKKKGFTVKQGRKVIINPSLAIEFSDNMILQLNMTSGS